MKTDMYPPVLGKGENEVSILRKDLRGRWHKRGFMSINYVDDFGMLRGGLILSESKTEIIFCEK